MFSKFVKFNGQDYNENRTQASARGVEFVDKEFPATMSNISSLPQANDSMMSIEWKRPSQIATVQPSLLLTDISNRRYRAGPYGGSAFPMACCCLAAIRDNWERVMCDYQSQEWDPAKPQNYTGIFRFRFWQDGCWVEVVIDDQLPTLKGELLYTMTSYKNEFWPSLLEKAYAKLIGGYETLKECTLPELLIDMTGGITETIPITDQLNEALAQTEFFEMLSQELANESLVTVLIPSPDGNPEPHRDDTTGLIAGQPYLLTKLVVIPTDVSILGGVMSSFRGGNKIRVRMARLRNPWDSGDWKGPFSEGSSEWEEMKSSIRNRIGLTFDDDTEFWIPFPDFIKQFKEMTILRQMNTSLISLRKRWHEAVFHGAWHGHLTGGCLNFRDTFLNNPQYMFQVDKPDGDEVQIFLMQKVERINRSQGARRSGQLIMVGFTVLKVESNRVYRVHRLENAAVEQSSPYNATRSVLLRLKLSRGRYVLTPCSYQPELEQSFLLRLFSSSDSHAREIIQDVPPNPACGWLFKYPEVATRVTVYRAENLESANPQRQPPTSNPYCRIECEGASAETNTVNDMLNPEWGESFIFFRKNPLHDPLVIQIFSRNRVIDDFLGRHAFPYSETAQGQVLQVGLLGKDTNTDRNNKRRGQLSVEFHNVTHEEFHKI